MKKKSVFLIVAIISVLLAGVGNVIWNNWEEKSLFNNPLNTETSDTRIIERDRYFLVQRSFTTLNNSLTINTLKKKKVAAFPENAEILKFFGIQPEQWITSTDPYAWVNSTSFDGYIIVPLELSDHRLKTIRVDGQMIWDPLADLSQYPLKWTEEVTLQLNEDVESIESFDNSKVITYIAGGEVIPARAVARKFRRVNDYTFPFSNVRSLFKDADISSILLENAISGKPEPCHGCTWFVGDEDFIDGLIYLDVDVVSLAGNHMGDGGEVAVERTIEVLDDARVKHCGASGENQNEASEPAIVVRRDFRIAFLCYDDVAYYHWASDERWGVARYSERYENGTKSLLTEKIKQDVGNAREISDFVVVIVSWGDREYVNWPLDYQKEVGHAFIDAGADLIVGSHQHWASALEIYQEKPIYYGLGNFIFDQTHTDPTRQGIFVKFYFYDKKIVNMEVVPHETCGPHQSSVDDENCFHYQPYLLPEESQTYQEIMERVFEYSII